MRMMSSCLSNMGRQNGRLFGRLDGGFGGSARSDRRADGSAAFGVEKRRGSRRRAWFPARRLRMWRAGTVRRAGRSMTGDGNGVRDAGGAGEAVSEPAFAALVVERPAPSGPRSQGRGPSGSGRHRGGGGRCHDPGWAGCRGGPSVASDPCGAGGGMIAPDGQLRVYVAIAAGGLPQGSSTALRGRAGGAWGSIRSAGRPSCSARSARTGSRS